MTDYLDNAKDEMKRVDHLLFVSLKYTRTVDVIISVMERMISCIDNCMDALLEKVKRRRKTLEVPTTPRQKADLVRDIFSDDEIITSMMDFYLHLRNLVQAKYTKREEYRRHVTMIAEVKGRTVEVEIDDLNEFYLKLKDFLEYIQREKL
ncbi:hypothetical protein GF336_05755 [Candidatus Woesearchaeota archaeon]|nr:hypothetical protein [Candidatus Woesearchaeota archaeon]